MRLTACLLLLLAPILAAQPAKELSVGEKIFFDPAIRDADYDTHAATLIGVIEQDPASVEALVALRRLDELEDQLASTRPIYEMLNKLAGDDFQSCGRWANEYADNYVEYARNYSATDTPGGWKQVAKRWRGITEASFVGPFGEGHGSCHDDVFSPEVMLDFGAEYPGAFGPIKWQKIEHRDPLKAELSIQSQKRWNGYGYYVATKLLSESERDGILQLQFDGPGKVWLNGECVADYDARRRDYPDTKTLDVSLVKGRNLLTVKLSALSQLTIRLTDRNGRPLENVLAAAPTADDPKLVVQTRSVETSDVPPEILLVDETYGANVGADVRIRKMMLRVIHEHHGQREYASMSFWDYETDIGLDYSDCYAYERLKDLDSSPLFSGSQRRQAKRATIAGMTSTFRPAYFAFAELYTDDERFRDAIQLLESTCDAVEEFGSTHEFAPLKWRVYLHMNEVFEEAGWDLERERVIKLALKDAPEALPVLRAASRYYSTKGAMANEIAIDRRILELVPGDRDAHVSLMHTLTRAGDNDGALKHARLLVGGDPTNSFLLTRFAEILAAADKMDEALQVYENLAAMDGRPEEALFTAANVCLQNGLDAKGEALLERVVKADPGHHLARRQLQLMRGESEDFWSAQAVSWDEAIKHDITSEDFPRADSVLILDELIQWVYEDGSSVSYVRTIRKILTQEGVDIRGRDQITGELVNARTIQADGTVLEPIAQANGLIEYPGVEVGCYLDTSYLIRNDGGPTKALDGDAFFFMDYDMAEPFAITRWVVMTPEKMNHNILYHNMRPDDEGVSISQTTADGRTTYIWDLRNPRHPERESFMPGALEVIPSVEFVQPRDWRENARELADDGLRKIMQTPLISQQAIAITEGRQTDHAKAEETYKWVNENFTTEGDTWNAHQALVANAGDREELFISLCAAAEVEFGFAYVDAAQRYKSPPEEQFARPSWAYPFNDDDFSEFLIVVQGDDGLIYIDMKDRLRPFGEISSRMFDAPAIVWLNGEYELTHLPGGNREKDRFENRVTVQLNPDGSAALTGSITVRGERSYAMKESMRTSSKQRLKKGLEADLAQHYPGFEINQCDFLDVEVVGKPVVRSYEGDVARMARATDDGLSLELPGEKLGRLLSILVSEQDREFDIALMFDLVQRDETRIKPPAGYAFAEIPDDLVYPTSPLVYSLKFRLDGGDLVVSRKLVLGPGRFGVEEYGNLVEQVKQIKQSEGSKLKLKKTE